uniref:Leucine-rich repeat flightless-interacting protein 2 n=1 Tax=Zeugodacus cucurbitae TaxID=28588 RepID=A0A0A1X612_ZEUCU
MEPTIKYENCEDIFIGPAGVISPCTGQKRHFDNITEGNEYEHGAGSYSGFIAPTNQALYSQFQNTAIGQQESKPAKRYRRGESAVLFSPPFFEVPDGINAQSDTFTARCVSCQVILRGHKNVSSNFIKHMKRSHPEVHKMYENYKLLKQHSRNMNLLANKSSAASSEQSFLDASTLLDNIQSSTAQTANDTVENEQNSETTENSQPNSNADLNDTNENSVESQPHKNDISISEVNLSSKTLQAISKIFDEKLKSFVTKAELSDVTKNIINQVRSRQSTPCSATVHDVDNDDDEEVADKKQDNYKTIEKELDVMRRRLSHSEHSKRILQRELHTLEKIVRKRKLIINNIPIQQDQQPQTAVEQLLKERFDMPNVQLESVTVIGNRNRTHNDRQTLLVEVVRECDVNAIFRKSACLKNTGIYIDSQMSQISLKRKEKLLVLRREMLRRNESLKIVVRNTQLVVCGTYFYWDDLLGLCVGNLDMPDTNLVSDDAAEELKKLTKLDMREFLSVLKNYDIR